MGDAYPELREQQQQIEAAIRGEEEQFARTLEQGMGILDEALADMQGTVIPGEVVFRLYDTYGFPVDLTNDIARERDLDPGHGRLRAVHGRAAPRSKESGSFSVDYNDVLRSTARRCSRATTAIRAAARSWPCCAVPKPVEMLGGGESGVVILDRTPFYAESGGQVGDTVTSARDGLRLEVTRHQQGPGPSPAPRARAGGYGAVGDTLNATIDNDLRQQTRLNHSATHLLHAALRRCWVNTCRRSGSLVDAQRLRFDISHPEAMTAQELQRVEDLVNAQIRANTPVTTELMTMDAARAAGAMALFGEKYGDEVRVLTMGTERFSVELCGGTHVARTGDIGLLRIVPRAVSPPACGASRR
jgi:alanyl-tRNA synthetase